jgi:hypothetical protein
MFFPFLQTAPSSLEKHTHPGLGHRITNGKSPSHWNRIHEDIPK